ncbi:MAG: YggS family pyridoxal phosphate-dependent enzyme [Proteobacteria bacterium]|nr:YggS family pyridoxal phosphate-dependent enzyme [Pseudomonadota bacterium]MBU1709218.1 YggS family pyridoxal phosphate-dependent enzyme [Pseudomonadota bacterium]
MPSSIKENLHRVRERIARAANRAGRSTENIKLVAVSKRQSTQLIREAVVAGQRVFGENFIQEAQGKINALDDLDISWHYIGQLQSNKAKIAADIFQMIETIDRVKLANMLEKHLTGNDQQLSVLAQINIGREKQKGGVLPENAEEFLEELQQYSHVRVRGLMTMPPFISDPEKLRPYFREMRQLAEQFAARGLFSDQGQVELSMGMSGDFEVAIEEGATLVRVGTAIFGAR